MLKAYANQYDRFAEPGTTTAFGAYGHRIANNADEDQLRYAATKLMTKPDTRQCVITLWRPDDLLEEDRRDLPCTVCLQYIVQDKHLHVCTYMRSNDAWLGFPYDIFCFTGLQMLMAGTLGLQLGTYTHFVGNMHLYAKNEDAAQEAISQRYVCESPINSWALNKLGQERDALRLEEKIRIGANAWMFRDELADVGLALDSMLVDLVAFCATKFKSSNEVSSPALKKGLENVNNRRS